MNIDRSARVISGRPAIPPFQGGGGAVRLSLGPGNETAWILTGPPVLYRDDVKPVAPVAYQVILEPGIGQFREFEPRRVHTRINSLGLFLVHKLTCGQRESVS